MSTIALPVPRELGARLVRAEILKLATRRGLMIATLLLTVGATVATFGILAVLHATDPAHHKPIGGLSHLAHRVYSPTPLGTRAAALIGAPSGGRAPAG